MPDREPSGATGQRRWLITGVSRGLGRPIGGPELMAGAIIATAGDLPAPRRVVLGSDSYAAITTALTARLADIEAQATSAGRTDYIDQKENS